MWGILPPSPLHALLCPVHPHVCGEYLSVNDDGVTRRGSSPRVWGILETLPLDLSGQPVHPHVCGEYVVRSAAFANLPGSSPRVWGILPDTPLAASASAVHPHVCGEYLLTQMADRAIDGSSPRVWGIRISAICSAAITHGSSPRVWGILISLLPLGLGFRFIPTCVGNTIQHDKILFNASGSSPRVWGIRSRVPSLPTARTVHPHVCGEYARDRLRRSARRTVHPHVCGEYCGLFRLEQYEHGSSPRVWGIRFPLAYLVPVNRFIPTCVGNTSMQNGSRVGFFGSSPRVWGILINVIRNSSNKTVHPHVCGEYSVGR